MAAHGKVVLEDAVITIDGVDLSVNGNHVEITSDKPLIDVSGFGAAMKENKVGMGDGSMKFTFVQSFDAGSVDATLWPIHDNETAVVVTVKAYNEAVSTDNPLYTMTGVLPSYSPLNGDLNAASTIDATFNNADPSGIVRTTA